MGNAGPESETTAYGECTGDRQIFELLNFLEQQQQNTYLSLTIIRKAVL